MSSERLQRWLAIFCALGLLGGCASPRPAQTSTTKSSQDNGEYNGRLFRSLTGHSASTTGNTAQTVAATAPKLQSGQASQPGTAQAVSYSAPADTTPGPLVPGPASPSNSKMPDTPYLASGDGTSIAGPPPTIPAELPPPPGGAISINDSAAEKKGFEWSDLAPDNVYKNAKAAAGYGPDEKIARAAMQEGRVLFSQKKYKEAAAKFATAANRWPDTPLEEDALFLKGESEFFSDQCSAAHDTYGGLLKKYTNTRHLETVSAREFAIGRYWEQKYDDNPSWPVTPNVTDKSKPMFDTFGYAIQAYERVRLNDPTGPLADDSLLALANAYFRHGRYEDAAYNYNLLIKEYPNSPHQQNAHLLGLQAKMRVYQGTTYIGGPLKDAKELADQTLIQFGDKLGEERQNVLVARAQLLEEQANREFTLGKYYEKREYYGAARMYYQSVIDSFPTTEKAKEAKACMDKIQGKPDSPPGQFDWLTGMFSTKKQE